MEIVDLVKSSPTSFWSRKSVLIQPRKSVHKFWILYPVAPRELNFIALSRRYYERPFGSAREPQSFMELVRNALCVKLTAHAGLVVRSCFSRDRKYAKMLISSRVVTENQELNLTRIFHWLSDKNVVNVFVVMNQIDKVSFFQVQQSWRMKSNTI